MELAQSLDEYIWLQNELIEALQLEVRYLKLALALTDDDVSTHALQSVPASQTEGDGLTVASRGHVREQPATLSGARRSNSR